MTQYIDKSALVAEINKRIVDAPINNIGHQRVWAYNDVKDIIDTLEVKEEDLLTEKKTEKELAESYINIFDKKFGDKLPNLKSKQLAEFKNFINTCEQIFHLKYFDYHATQGKLFEKLALLWAAWGKEHLSLEVKEVDLEEEIDKWYNTKASKEFENVFYGDIEECAKYFFELGLNAQQNIHIDITSIDKVIKENGIDPNSKEAKIFKESYYIALEKLKARKGE